MVKGTINSVYSSKRGARRTVTPTTEVHAVAKSVKFVGYTNRWFVKTYSKGLPLTKLWITSCLQYHQYRSFKIANFPKSSPGGMLI